MRGRKLTMDQLRERANREKPRRGTKAYMLWWKARTALGIPVKGQEKSQSQLLKERMK